ncbi:hypothetical protein BP6252_11268 [Coleophoma cylindrospora]|uniref:Uncharacterized protein n=1 Tax=Coleophoma cylindrospora TaxID=1849047 RepID=A0A3D8QPH3_9HELO|nr:hypothetical protein BP6252_11268 [Coleophoma cylindrospora]
MSQETSSVAPPITAISTETTTARQPEKARKIQPWKLVPDLAKTGKTWEEMPFKIINEKEIRLVDVYRTMKGS